MYHTAKSHMVFTSYASILFVSSYLVWAGNIEKEPTPSVLTRLAVLLLVIAWTHLLVWLFRKMSRHEISSGYCSVLFFGAWTVFFLVQSCLL